jgi:hypothetical protein
VGKFDEVFPDCSIPIPRSPAVAQPFDFDHSVGDESPQLQVFRSWTMGLFHDEPPLKCGGSMATEECIMKSYVL